MARQEIKVMEFTCDGCGKEVWVPLHDGPPVPWFNGTVIWHHGGGGSGGEWDACSEKCIKKAILAVVHA